MEIIVKNIKLIDIDNNKVIDKGIPENFSEFANMLIKDMNESESVRRYKTLSLNTEVISSIINIIKNTEDNNIVNNNMNIIAKRLLLKELEVEQRIERMNVNVQRGSLIQAVLYDSYYDKYAYILAKVEHTGFFDDVDFSVKYGFSKDNKKIWKYCIFEIEDLDSDIFYANVHSYIKAKYWSDSFLELEPLETDERNTDKAFRAIDAYINRNIKKKSSRDYICIRNEFISYFKSHKHIDYLQMVDDIFLDYEPIDLTKDELQKYIDDIKELPSKKGFDMQFNSIQSVINAKIKKVYDVCTGVQLKITDAIDNINDVICSGRDSNGELYVKIKVDNVENPIYKEFLRE